MIIAIDGPAAAGKGTLARRLAEHFGLAFLDTGLLYWAVGMNIVRSGADSNDPVLAEAAAKALTPKDLEAEDLRTDAAADAASRVSAVPGVRAQLLEFQRHFAADPPGGAKGTVLDGRDIGTVVCPEADAKIYLDASVEARAKRRVKELRLRGVESIESRVLQEMQDRDARDSGRAVAPLRAADDALRIDTTDLSPDKVFDRALSYIAERLG